MKKKISLLLVACSLLSALCFTSCSGSQSGNADIPVASEKTIEYTDENGTGFSILSDGTLEVAQISDVTKVVIPEKYNGRTVTSVGKSAFRMSEVKKVTLPDTVTKIEDFAFAFAKNLKTVNIPEGVKNIGNNAFNGCTSLKDIQFPESLETIEMYAFDGSGLETVALPINLATIGEYAFAECPYLEDVIFDCNNVEIADTAFQRSSNVVFFAEKKSTAITYAKSKGIQREIIQVD